MRLSAEEVSWNAARLGFSKAPVDRMIRLFDVRGTCPGGDAGNPAYSATIWMRDSQLD